MNPETKKVAAALAAVNEWMREEAADRAAAPAPGPALGPSLWALAGRQDLVTQRTMVTGRRWN